jgi:hypothetical protein
MDISVIGYTLQLIYESDHNCFRETHFPHLADRACDTSRFLKKREGDISRFLEKPPIEGGLHGELGPGNHRCGVRHEGRGSELRRPEPGPEKYHLVGPVLG